MTTFEDKEIIDYTIKRLEKILKPENFMLEDLDKMHNRLVKQEEKLGKIISKIKILERRVRTLERVETLNSSSSSSE